MAKRALFSLYETHKASIFAEELIKLGWEIIASEETAKILSAKGMPVTNLADFTGVDKDYGVPPTLHPKVEYLLTSDGMDERLDLVYIINYPLSVGNDVGGRTILALAAKGKRIPVCSLADMEMVVSELKSKGDISDDFRSRLIDKVNASISHHYDALVADRMRYDAVFGSLRYNLLNGENPYQVPASLFEARAEDSLSLHKFIQLSGETPCFTNLADSDCLIHTISLTAEAFEKRSGKCPYICVASKHGNPCGMAVDWDVPGRATEKALFGNPRAVWGGEVITNFAVDGNIAEVLRRSTRREAEIGSSAWMLDVVLAPGFSGEAIEILGKNKRRKLLANEVLHRPFLARADWSYRFVRGGFLRQPANSYVLDFEKTELVGRSENDLDSLTIAWAVAYSSFHGGNEVATAKDAALLSCCGAPSTVESVRHCIFKAEYLEHDLDGSVFAADAFFPFVDAPELLAKAGVRAGIVPSGGKAMVDVEAFFGESDISMYYIPEAYRGFCRH
jgi:phosphoribosylaminoimidazolecarboxamide formyltransferase / IMP cyclohydrolase